MLRADRAPGAHVWDAKATRRLLHKRPLAGRWQSLSDDPPSHLRGRWVGQAGGGALGAIQRRTDEIVAAPGAWPRRAVWDKRPGAAPHAHATHTHTHAHTPASAAALLVCLVASSRRRRLPAHHDLSGRHDFQLEEPHHVQTRRLHPACDPRVCWEVSVRGGWAERVVVGRRQEQRGEAAGVRGDARAGGVCADGANACRACAARRCPFTGPAPCSPSGCATRIAASIRRG